MDETPGHGRPKTRQCRARYNPNCTNVFSIGGPGGTANRLDCEDCVALRRRGVGSSSEARRAYQRRYYQMHKEKAQEYQRQYKLTHKKKARGGRGRSSFTAPREMVKTAFSRFALMRLPPEKFGKIVNKITRGERLLTL